jgi:hypothetical protein
MPWNVYLPTHHTLADYNTPDGRMVNITFHKFFPSFCPDHLNSTGPEEIHM